MRMSQNEDILLIRKEIIYHLRKAEKWELKVKTTKW